MKARLLLMSLMVSFVLCGQTPNDTWAVKFSNAMIFRYSPTINALTAKGWEYSNTIITHGMEKVYNNVTDSVKYLNYIKAYVDAYVNSSGVISATINSLDRTHPGISCLFLYEKTGQAKYLTAATTLRNLYVGAGATYPKTATGNIFWHKNNGSYNNIILIDGVYMLHPFLARYGKLVGDNAAIDTAINQTLYIYNQLYDGSRNLIRHAWNPTKTEAWADPVTGNSSEVWSRGMGWFTMALVDILKNVPAAHPKRAQLLTALSNLAIGIQTYQDATTGLWYQVVDKGTTLAGNYLETSGSAMFVYTLKTAVDSGWISNSYLTVAQKAWNFLKVTTNGKITIHTDTYPKINDFAPAMSVQTSAANYVQASLQPVDVPGTTHPHGYAAILMAAAVMEFPISLVTLPVHFTAFTVKKTGNDVLLHWENNDESGTEQYEVKRSSDGRNFETIATVVSDGSGLYNWPDHPGSNGKTYYRITAITPDGKTVSTQILYVNSKTNGTFGVSPNPVTGKQVNVSANGLIPGNYQLTLYNAAGSLLMTKRINVGSESQYAGVLDLPTGAQGICVLKFESGTVKRTQTLLIQD